MGSQEEIKDLKYKRRNLATEGQMSAKEQTISRLHQLPMSDTWKAYGRRKGTLLKSEFDDQTVLTDWSNIYSDPTARDTSNHLAGAKACMDTADIITMTEKSPRGKPPALTGYLSKYSG
jgi:hypothetical protein